MPKQSKVAELEAQVKAQSQALSEARKGLFHIVNINPVTYQVELGNGLKIVKAFKEAQATAERTILNISDAEQVDAV